MVFDPYAIGPSRTVIGSIGRSRSSYGGPPWIPSSDRVDKFPSADNWNMGKSYSTEYHAPVSDMYPRASPTGMWSAARLLSFPLPCVCALQTPSDPITPWYAVMAVMASRLLCRDSRPSLMQRAWRESAWTTCHLSRPWTCGDPRDVMCLTAGRSDRLSAAHCVQCPPGNQSISRPSFPTISHPKPWCTRLDTSPDRG